MASDVTVTRRCYTLTQQEKAKEVLDRLFSFEPYRRNGLSEAFLRDYARKKWVGPNEPLDGDVLIAEAESRAAHSTLKKFYRKSAAYFKAATKSGFRK